MVADESQPSDLRRAAIVVAILIAATVAGLGVFVAKRQGNLAWDDADYLQRGLRLARMAQATGLAGLPDSIVRTLRERPKPPMLIAWIEALALATGRQSLSAILLGATVVPYALLLLSVAIIARRLHDSRTSPIAVVCLLASPMSLAYGGKVMVETFMSLWTLWTFYFAARVLEKPTKPRAIGLGVALGLATLTKITVVLFLTVPAVAWIVLLLRRRREIPIPRDLWAWICLPALVIAGPWYALNLRETLAFAAESSRYNLLADSPLPTPPRWHRVIDLAENLPGWPLLVAGGVTAVGAFARRTRPSDPAPPAVGSNLTRLALLGAGSGTLILLLTSHFDPRFLLPVWPALAVSLGGFLRATTLRSGRAGASIVYGAVAVGVAMSWTAMIREPSSTTHWEARQLIDDLTATYQIRTLANIGDMPDWNVCKTGLINEFRANPSDCFVLFNLSQSRPEELETQLGRLDAVVVLDREAFPPGHLEYLPGFNRAYGSVARALSQNRYDRVETPTLAGLPPLSVYVRRR